jgi:hypothetical protein
VCEAGPPVDSSPLFARTALLAPFLLLAGSAGCVLMFGGAVATEGGLVFYGDIEGYLNGLDAETGETVWRDRAAKGYLGPPITFQVDGHQRIAIVSRPWGHGLRAPGRPPLALRGGPI